MSKPPFGSALNKTSHRGQSTNRNAPPSGQCQVTIRVPVPPPVPQPKASCCLGCHRPESRGRRLGPGGGADAPGGRGADGHAHGEGQHGPRPRGVPRQRQRAGAAPLPGSSQHHWDLVLWSAIDPTQGRRPLKTAQVSTSFLPNPKRGKAALGPPAPAFVAGMFLGSVGVRPSGRLTHAFGVRGRGGEAPPRSGCCWRPRPTSTARGTWPCAPRPSGPGTPRNPVRRLSASPPRAGGGRESPIQLLAGSQSAAFVAGGGWVLRRPPQTPLGSSQKAPSEITRDMAEATLSANTPPCSTAVFWVAFSPLWPWPRIPAPRSPGGGGLPAGGQGGPLAGHPGADPPHVRRPPWPGPPPDPPPGRALRSGPTPGVPDSAHTMRYACYGYLLMLYIILHHHHHLLFSLYFLFMCASPPHSYCH